MAKAYYLRRDEAIRDILGSSDLTEYQKLVGIWLLMQHMNSHSEVCWPSCRQMAETLRSHVSTVERATRRLHELEFLT